jgi:hypothetical protein
MQVVAAARRGAATTNIDTAACPTPPTSAPPPGTASRQHHRHLCPAQRYNRECFACRAGAELTVGLVHAPGPRGAPTDRSIRTRE